MRAWYATHGWAGVREAASIFRSVPGECARDLYALIRPHR